MTDQQLLDRWRDGDRAAGNDLFERHFLVVCNFFRNKVSDHVDDLIQRTFVACLEGADQFRGDASFRSYLLGIARNVLFRHYREQGRDGRTFEPLSTSACDLDPSPSAMVAGRERHAQLLQALRKLPLDLQIALELHFWESWTIKEMAATLEIPQGTAASRLRRAKDALRERLGKRSLATPTDADVERWVREIRATLSDQAE